MTQNLKRARCFEQNPNLDKDKFEYTFIKTDVNSYDKFHDYYYDFRLISEVFEDMFKIKIAIVDYIQE